MSPENVLLWWQESFHATSGGILALKNSRKGAHSRVKFKGPNFVLLFPVRTKNKTLFKDTLFFSKMYIALELEFPKLSPEKTANYICWYCKMPLTSWKIIPVTIIYVSNLLETFFLLWCHVMVMILFNQHVSLYHRVTFLMGVGPVLFNKNMGKFWRFNFNLNLSEMFGGEIGGCGGEPGGQELKFKLLTLSKIVKKMESGCTSDFFPGMLFGKQVFFRARCTNMGIEDLLGITFPNDRSYLATRWRIPIV